MTLEEIRAMEVPQEQAAGRFYTPVEGMVGTGAPLVAAASVSMTENRPEQVGGGTYSGMEVTQEVMEAIKRGNGGNIFYFEENPKRPGYYSMHPTYPEYGADAPGEKPYKIRENINWLYKGIASRFINSQGALDFRAGLRFMGEFESRVFNDYSEENPLLPEEEIRKGRIQWLCNELRIPGDVQEDFSRFAESCMAPLGENPNKYAFAYSNLTSIISNWCGAGIVMEETMKGSQPEEEEFRNYQAPGFVRSCMEIFELAGIDPHSERRMIIPTECSGSAYANDQLFKRESFASQNRTALGIFDINIKKMEEQLVERKRDIENEKNKLQHHHMDNDSQEERERLFSERLGQLEQELVDVQSEIDERGIEDPDMMLKWEFHAAVKAASFEMDQPDGTRKTYFITLEGFAPESNVMMDHAGMSMDVSIGIYESEEDFIQYYRQDQARVRTGDPISNKVSELHEKRDDYMRHSMKKLYAFPKELDTREIQQQAALVRQSLQQDMTAVYCGKKPDGDDDEKVELPGPVLGISIEGAASLYEPEHRKMERRAKDFISRIPSEYRAQYQALVDAYGYLNYKINDLANQEMCLDGIADMQDERLSRENLSPTEQNEVRERISKLHALADEAENASIPGRQAREHVSAVLAGILEGQIHTITNEEELDSVNQILHDYGLTADAAVALAVAVQGNTLPVSEIHMDIQEALPGLAGRLIEVEDFRNANEMAVNFAVDNFDSAIKGAFLPEEREALNVTGMEFFERIMIDGLQVSQILSAKYPAGQITEELAKCEVMAAACRGEQVEFALGWSIEDESGKVRLNATSRIPEVQEFVARKEAGLQSQEERRPNYDERTVGNESQRFRNLYNELRNADSAFHINSREFRNVLSALDQLCGKTEALFAQDERDRAHVTIEEELTQIKESYDNLQAACAAYLEKNNGIRKTELGNVRSILVGKIQDLAVEDKNTLDRNRVINMRTNYRDIIMESRCPRNSNENLMSEEVQVNEPAVGAEAVPDELENRNLTGNDIPEEIEFESYEQEFIAEERQPQTEEVKAEGIRNTVPEEAEFESYEQEFIAEERHPQAEEVKAEDIRNIEPEEVAMPEEMEFESYEQAFIAEKRQVQPMSFAELMAENQPVSPKQRKKPAPGVSKEVPTAKKSKGSAEL